jgi:hypothetical protein
VLKVVLEGENWGVRVGIEVKEEEVIDIQIYLM